MPRDDEIYLTPESARRVSAAVRAVERMTSGSAPPGTAPRITSPGKYAIITTAITAAVRATSTLGKGAGTLQLVTYNPSTDVATYASMGVTVPIYSGALSTIATGRLIKVSVVDGRYQVDADYC